MYFCYNFAALRNMRVHHTTRNMYIEVDENIEKSRVKEAQKSAAS